MRMNSSMQRLLESMRLSRACGVAEVSQTQVPQMVMANGSVLLADQYRLSITTSPNQFPDRTGYECFVNHVHLPFDGTRAAMLQLMGRIEGLRKSLRAYAPDRNFQITLSIANGEGTIRFHERRPGEAWLADDLEGYTQEAVAAIDVGAE